MSAKKSDGSRAPRSGLTAKKIVDKNGVSTTVYVRADQDSKRSPKELKKAKKSAKPKSGVKKVSSGPDNPFPKRTVLYDAFNDGYDYHADGDTTLDLSSQALNYLKQSDGTFSIDEISSAWNQGYANAQLDSPSEDKSGREIPEEYRKVLRKHAPKFIADLDWGDKNLTRENIKAANVLANIEPTDGLVSEFARALDVSEKEAHNAWASLSAHWKNVVDPLSEKAVKQPHVRVIADQLSEDRKVLRALARTVNADNPPPTNEVRKALYTIHDTALDENAAIQTKGYVAVQHRRAISNRIAELSEQLSNYEGFLRGLDGEGTEGRNVLQFTSDESVAFSPTSAIDEDRVRELLTEDELEQIIERVTVEKITPARVREFLADEPETLDAVTINKQNRFYGGK